MLKVIELFAGVGSQTQALKNIGVEHEVVGISEIDKYAIESYMQLHGETKNFGDISKIEKLPKVDLWTYSFPCQDLSIAGKQAGIKEGTRSGLLLEVERLLECSEKPKYLLMENVKNLLSKKHKPDFDRWCEKLEKLGYMNYYEVLNAKDYGVPQNRERVFMISILGEHKPYKFPNKKDRLCKLVDFLENNTFSTTLTKNQLEVFENSKTHNKTNNEIVVEGYFMPSKHNSCRVIGIDGISPTIMENHGLAITILDNRFYNIKPSCKKNFEREYNEILSSDKEIYQCRCESGFQDNQIGVRVSPCLRANNPITYILDKNYVIRRLTPRECWRLMGWSDGQFDKIKGVSNTQLYKQAGNGIVVTVLEEIFRNLFLD